MLCEKAGFPWRVPPEKTLAHRTGRQMTVALAPVSPRRDWKRTITSPYLWIVVALLVVTTLLHFLTPQTRLLPAPVNAFLARHAVERFLFVLPVFHLGRQMTQTSIEFIVSQRRERYGE